MCILISEIENIILNNALGYKICTLIPIKDIIVIKDYMKCLICNKAKIWRYKLIRYSDKTTIFCDLPYLSIEKDIIVTIKTWEANSEITVARSQPKSPKGHGYDFHITINSNGITEMNLSECNFIYNHSKILKEIIIVIVI